MLALGVLPSGITKPHLQLSNPRLPKSSALHSRSDENTANGICGCGRRGELKRLPSTLEARRVIVSSAHREYTKHQNCRGRRAMTIEEKVLEKLRDLRSKKQEEVLDFVGVVEAETKDPGATREPPRALGGSRFHITEKDIAEARREMWGNLPRDIEL
jgi:hypothetical protein